MKGWSVSRKGKRELHIRKRVRFLPLFLIAAMLSGMLLTSSVGAKGGPADSYDQIVDGDGTLYYSAEGADATLNSHDISVSKTVTQKPGEENHFQVELEVTTHTNYELITVSKDSAVVLVVDLSGSMASECAECGQTVSASHSGHIYKSRIDVADGVLKAFLKAYKASADGAKRYLSIVGYASETINPQAQNWVDIAGNTDAQLNGIVDKMVGWVKAARPPMGTDTQTTVAMQYTNDRLDDEEIKNIHQRSVILMTDGMPASAGGTSISTGSVPQTFQSHYEGLKTFVANEAAKQPPDLGGIMFNAIPEAFVNPGAYGFMMRDKGAPLYTVSFISGTINYIAPQTMRRWMELFSDATYDASNADKLNTAFTEIIEKMTTTEPDTVTDVLPSWWKVDASGLEAKGAELRDGRIVWTLAKQTPTSSVNGTNTYELIYDVTLDNLSKGYPGSGQALKISNGEPTFTYYIYKDGSPAGPLRTVKLPILTVKSYDGEVSFYKTDPQGVVITKTLAESSRFKLSAGSWSSEMANDGDGKVTFYNVPSGHTYQLEELKAPAGHEKGTSTYSIDVAWGAAANSQIPQDVIKAADKVTVLAASGSRVVNKYLTGSKDITVQKTWIDTTEDYKNQSVTFNIYKSGDNTTPVKSGTMTIANATVPGGKTWKVTVTVPGKDAETGKELEYSVKETPIPGYTATYDGLNITNVAAPRTETVTITKVWRVPMPDEPEQATVDEATPENAQEAQTQDDTQEAQVQETREGETINAAAVATPPDAEITLILNSTDGTHKPFGNPHTLKANEATKKEVNGEYVYETKITVENVPVLADNGKPYTYRVEEAAMTGFHHVGTDMPNGTTFEVTNASDELLTTNVPFHKHWEGDEGHTSARVPVTVVLYANDGTGEKEVKRATLEATDMLGTNENVWAGSFDNLPRYVDDDVTKAKIVYRFEEITEVSGYLTSYDGIDIINTWNETSFRVTKNWVKPESAVTPSVTFELYRSDNNQKPYRTYTMPKEESSYTFADLPLYSTDRQTKYTYTVKEVVPTGYTSAQVGADFTNTIKQVYDVTVQGAIEWDLRGEDENVKPAEVLVQLYAGDKPCVYPADYSDVALRGEDVTRVAKASEGWTYKFEKAQRYTNGLTADIAYSVRELGADGTPAPDVSTVQFQSVVDAPGTLRSFGAHYREVTYDNAKSTFTANIFNHTDAEVAAYRIDRVYNYTLDGSTTAKSVPGTVEYHQPGTELSVNTEDYIRFDGKTYSFSAGMVSVTVDGSAEMFPVLKAGANTIRLEKTDRVYVVTLEYALSETTPPYVPDDPNPPKPPKPTEPTDPTTPPTTEPTTPPTEPTTPPTTEPTTPPTDPTTPPKPPKDPDIRPNPPVLTPEEEEKVDEVIKDVTEHPEHIIKDKDSFEEMFPEVSIEDLPPPLYWGPEFAIVDVPVYEEIVAIDSELVPLGNLPQTGSDLRATATLTALVGVGAMAAAGTIALGGWLVLRRKYREE